MNKKCKNKVIIDNDTVSKKCNEDILKLYDYLKISDFDNYPEIISYEDGYLKTKYIKSKPYHEQSLCEREMMLVAKLHKKTSFYKDTSKNNYDIIHEELQNNIEYLTDYYNKLIDYIENKIYLSPSEYLIERNYSLIILLLNKSKEFLNKWYKIVENKTSERVCYNHNNLSKSHYIKGDKDYLLSFDNLTVDTPILDLYKFYKKEAYNYNFKYLLKVYEEINKLEEQENMLLFALISMPPKIEKINNEFENTKNTYNSFKYIYSSINIINEK